MPALTLLVPVRDPGAELEALVASIDAQTAARDSFDVVFVDGGSTDGTPVRLERLAAARPNVTYLGASAEEDTAGLVRSGLAQATGDLVAVVPTGRRLTGQAVSLVVAAAADGADAVVGRASSRPAGDHLPLVDGALGTRPRPGWDGLLAVRTSTLQSTPDPTGTLLRLVPVDLGWDVVALGSVASFGQPWPATAPVAVGRLRWSGTELVVASVLAEDAGATAWLVLARADGSEEIALPAQVAPGPDGRLVATASVDLAPEGRQGDGVWHLRLRVRSGGSDRTFVVTGPVPAPAVLQGRQVVPSGTPAGITLDVGATRSSLLGRVPLADATLVETARGVQLTLRCVEAHVVGDARTPVTVLLGRFRLPAVLVCAGGAAHVEAWVSGLAGRSRISVLTGGDKPRRTGLDLVVAGAGVMTLDRTPRPTRPAPAQKAAPAPTGGLARLRRRVPAGLEPVVRRLAHVGPLREAYRRATRR